MAGSWADKLGAARRAVLVGRDREIELLEAFGRDPHARLAYVFGEAGSGKTLLLREWLSRRSHDGRVAVVDAQIDPARPGFIEAAGRDAALVVIDDFHRLASLEAWFYDVFLPSLPDGVRVVVASRRPPRTEELLDPAWRALMRVIDVRPLDPPHVTEYLRARGVPVESHAAIAAFARGLPLWLCVAADHALAHPDRAFAPVRAREKLGPVVSDLLEDAPSHLHRRAIHAASLARRVTESILARTLDASGADAARAYDWLRERPWVQRAGDGIRLHDALRDAVRADLETRDPDAARAMLDRLYVELLASVWRTSGSDQERMVVELSAALALEPGGRAFGGAGAEDFYADSVEESERPVVLDAIRRYEGDDAAEIADRWLAEERTSLVALRDADRHIAAFLVYVEVDESVPAVLRESDPFVPTLLEHLAKTAPLRPAESATIARWWVSVDSYQRPDPMQMRLFAHMGWRLAFVGGAVVGAVHADPEDWIAMPQRPHDVFGLFTLGGARYGIFGTDWRRTSRERWVERLVAGFRALPVGAPGPEIEFEVMGREAFGRAVRIALRTWSRRDRLAESALLGTRLVASLAPPKSSRADRVGALEGLLASGIESLRAQPKTQRHALVLERTFARPEAKGLVVADDLGLPYGSYRRILAEAVELVVDDLWAREIARRNG